MTTSIRVNKCEIDSSLLQLFGYAGTEYKTLVQHPGIEVTVRNHNFYPTLYKITFLIPEFIEFSTMFILVLVIIHGYNSNITKNKKHIARTVIDKYLHRQVDRWMRERNRKIH